MKKLLIINGSPNKEGHTKKIINYITQDISNEEVEIFEINCYFNKINPCVDCKYCSQTEGSCSLKDDMGEIYNHLKDSDFIILASPMYFGMFPAPLKAMIDRCQLIWSEKHIFNKNSRAKKGMLIFDSGSSWNEMFIPMKTIAKYFFNTINCSIEQCLYVTNTDDDKDYINNNISYISSCREILNKFSSES